MSGSSVLRESSETGNPQTGQNLCACSQGLPHCGHTISDTLRSYHGILAPWTPTPFDSSVWAEVWSRGEARLATLIPRSFLAARAFR